MDNQILEWLEVICKDFNRARSLTVLIMARHGEWDQLVNLVCNPSDYLSLSSHAITAIMPLWKCSPFNLTNVFSTFGVDAFRFDYQITELLRKCEDLPTTYDRTKAAKDSFLESEQTCAFTNSRLRTLRWQCDYSYAGYHDNRWVRFVEVWRGIVSKILGPLPETLNLKLSSGSTFNDRLYILPQDKMSNRPTSTLNCYNLIEPLWGKTLWSRSLCAEKPNRSMPLFIKGNRFSTVPKTAKTERGICVEPSLNVAYQLSVGSILRKRLRTVGIDLLSGQSLHKSIVDRASLTLDVGSIDLSSASDSISYELVKLILPEDWFELLSSLRSKYTRFENKWILNKKFSSMGNGYTFELETLIFYTLARTVSKVLDKPYTTLSVYGDDILFDAPLCRPLIHCLSFFGFSTNNRKTFITDTPFRESCGSDYYQGVNVRGYYIKKLPSEPIDWIKLANGIRRMASPDLNSHGDLYRYKRAWLRSLDVLPADIKKCRGPEHLGDAVIHDRDWERYIRKDGTIKALLPTFGSDSETRYDRRIWTRGSIIGAALLGSLSTCSNLSICHNGKWVTIKRKQRIPRHEPLGYHFGYILPSHTFGVKTYRWNKQLTYKLLSPPYILTF